MLRMKRLRLRNVSSACMLCLSLNCRRSPSPLRVTRSANSCSRRSLSSTVRSPRDASPMLSKTSASRYIWNISRQEYKSLYGPTSIEKLRLAQTHGQTYSP